METGSAPLGNALAVQGGLVVIRRLHRMVRHGYRPLLGYSVASGEDRDIQLRRRDGTARLGPDGAVTFTAAIRNPLAFARPGAPGINLLGIAGDDEALFDACFPANTPNKRNLVRRLYEIGIGG